MTRTATGPSSRLPFGQLREFLSDRIGFLSRAAGEHGDVVKLKVGRRTYLLSNPEDIKHVLISNAANYTKTHRLHSRRSRKVLGDGLLTSTDAIHLRKRRMLQPMFARKSVETLADTIVRQTEATIGQWKAGDSVEIGHAMLDLTQRVAIRVLFGNDAPADLTDLMRDVAIRRRYYEHMLGSTLPFPELLPVQAVRDYRPAIKRLDELIHRAIARCRAEERLDDMLSGFVHARYEDGSGMSDREIRDEALSFMDTGYTTIAAALTWTWYLLATHPHADEVFRAEVQSVLPNGPPGMQDIRSLRYTRMAFDEAMRIYPPTWMFVRMTREADTLPGGVRLPAGAKLFLCPWIVHRNPNYFPEPERFRPERFDETADSKRPRFAYFPFGGGPHTCIGEQFAQTEGVLVLASIARKFRLELLPNQSITPEPGIALRPKAGIRMKLIPSASAS